MGDKRIEKRRGRRGRERRKEVGEKRAEKKRGRRGWERRG